MNHRDLHVHTTFCDGENTPEQIVREAIARGITVLGFSGHSHTPFDESYCMSPEGTEAYKAEIRRLQKEWRNHITILLGVEQDYWSDAPTDGYDYVIGSVHYLHLGGEYVPVDESPEILLAAADKYFGGDLIALCQKYYETVAGVAEKTGCQIIGHFDLISKFNEGGRLFDPSLPRYRSAWQQAAAKLLESGALFEVNTGAMLRGLRTEPYPSLDILRFLQRRGGKVILTSDSHRADTLCGSFDRAARFVRRAGMLPFEEYPAFGF
ncbi:MAG: histidinol-phosphatase [Lachnospiraceae bacterium]|nr:histidinol-phosphatase [Lachnospiraceae bacterium]